MNVFDRFRVAFGRTLVKAASRPVFPQWLTASFTEPTFRALTREGYKANTAVYACLARHAFAFPEPELRVYREAASGSLTPVGRHALVQLLRHPNPVMGRRELMQYTILYMGIGGNCYWWKQRSRAKQVVRLWPLSDAQMTPIMSPTNLLDHYEIPGEAGEEPTIVPREDVVHFKWLPDPAAPWRGQAPLVAAAREVDTDNETTRYLFQLLKNDSIPRLVIFAPPNAMQMTPEDKDAFDVEWQDRYGGAKRGRPAILAGESKVQQLSLDLQQLAFEALRKVPEARIAAAFMIPPIVAGLNVGLANATYSNYAEAVKHFTRGTLVPLWRNVDSEITSDLLPEFSDRADEIAAFDITTVAALQEEIAATRQWVDNSVRGGYVLVNEGRAALGLPKDPAGDVYLRGMALYEVPFGTGRPELPAPASAPSASGDASGTGRAVPSADAATGSADGAGKGLRPRGLRLNRRPGWATKGARERRQFQRLIIASLRQDRRTVGGRLESAVNGFFGELADRVTSRARRLAKGATLDVAFKAASLPDAEELLPFSDFEELETIIKRFYVELLTLSWGTLNLALEAELAFDVNDPAVVRALAGAGTRIRQIHETTLEQVRKALQYGYENGWSVDDLVRGDPEAGVPGLRDLVEQTYKDRARTIARTEIGTAQNDATAGRFKSAGVEKVFVMDNGLDDDDEPCKIVNETVQTMTWAEEHPLEHPNCLPGDSLVLADDVLAAFAREFHGEVVILRTAGDHTLTCTPNHPILTDGGWLAAGCLRKGDKVISYSGRDFVTMHGLVPDDNQMPAAIKDVFCALGETRGVPAAVVPGSPVDFHGDGQEGDVNIVLADGDLWRHDQAAFLEHVNQVEFGGTGEFMAALFTSQGTPPELVVGPDHAADGIVSGGDIGDTLLNGSSLGGELGGATAVMDRQLKLVEASSQTAIGKAKLARESSDTLAGHVAGVDDCIVDAIGRLETEATPDKCPAKLFECEAGLIGKVSQSYAGQVALVEVVEVNRREYRGHVYNLSTLRGYYIANGLIVKNCTRAFAPEFD